MPNNKFAPVVILIFSTLSCSAPVAPKINLPSQIADWHIIPSSQSCVAPVPPNLNNSLDAPKARQACTAQYSGIPNISVTLYDMPDSSTAFEAIQHWAQPPTGKGAFYKDKLFVIVESPSTDLPTLARFANALKSALTRDPSEQ